MKTLGLDIGTNSIGWGIVDEAAGKIEDCGVYIFPEGVKKEKGNESSKAKCVLFLWKNLKNGEDKKYIRLQEIF